MKKNKYIKKIISFWRWTWDDKSFLSYISAIILSIIIIQFLIFPVLGLIFKNDFPIVTIVSGSMEHKIVNGKICSNSNLPKDKSLNFDSWWNYCGDYYKNFNLTKNDFENFPNKNGLDIGDVLIIYKKKIENINIGDSLVFIPNDKVEKDKIINGKLIKKNESIFFNLYGPVIHRIVKIENENGIKIFTTKGDHNSISQKNFENKLTEENIIGVEILVVPYLGLPKYYLSKILGFA